jgi:CheY-like chemotaxis protein
VIYGVANALDRARQPGAVLPDALVIAEQALEPHTDLRAVRAVLPDACLHLLIRPDWHAPLLAEQAQIARIGILVAPLTPAQLRRLGMPHPAMLARDPNTAESAGSEVLLVEDNSVNQMLGQEFLRQLGLRARVAADGHEAIAACLERAPALVLMDVQMPHMDGLQATRELRALQTAGRWRGCPIVALTAHAGDDERRACQAAGMNAMLTKPLSIETLRAELAKWLA